MGDLNSSNNMKDSAAISLGGQLMVGAIFVLFLLVVFFFFLHLYYRWLSRRNGQSLNWHTPVFHPVSESVRGLRRGLEPSIIQSIPVVVFHPDEFKGGLECSVCLCELSEGEKARRLPKCNHGFHLDCIDMWFQSHSTCPLCRNPVEIQVPEVNPEDGFSVEPRNFPTNVLFWATPDQIAQSGSSGVEENESTSCSSSATSASLEGDGRVVIDIPRQSTQNFSFPPPSSVQFAEEELKSPTAVNRLKSLKRLLSGEKRVIPCSPTGSDVEQGLKVHSTQAASDS